MINTGNNLIDDLHILSACYDESMHEIPIGEAYKSGFYERTCIESRVDGYQDAITLNITREWLIAL